MSTPVPVEMRTISHSNVLCTFNLGCVPAVCPENLIWRSRLIGKSFVLYPWPHLKNDSHSGAPIFVCLKVLHGLCEVDPALDANIQKSFQIWYSNHVTYFVKHKIPYVFFFLPRFSFIDTGNSWDSRGKEWSIFVPLYHFHSLTNIQVFVCNFACEMAATDFCRIACNYQTSTRWDFPPEKLPFNWLLMAVEC